MSGGGGADARRPAGTTYTTPLTVRVTGAADQGALLTVLTSLPQFVLDDFLARQRWSGARLGVVRDSTVVALIPMPGEPLAALAVVTAQLHGVAEPARFQLPVALAPAAHAAALGEQVIVNVLAADGTQAAVIDACHDARFRAGLHAFLAGGDTVEHRGARLTAERARPEGHTGAPPTSRLVGAEQSNSSIIYDDGSIVKLFRRLEPGEHPDVEIGRFLAARADFPHTPRLRGVLRYEDEAGTAVAAMWQELVPGARDAWSYTLDRARADVEAAAAGTVHWSYAADAERLGAVTRRLHEALAAETEWPAFAPERATREDVARWAAATQRSIAHALDLLARQLAAGTITGPLADEAANMVAWRDAFLARAEGVVDLVGDDAGQRIRHHGDYHLGQVLRGESGEFVVIDFEGEPMRPLAERRAKHSALRDVAGMLRSFAYAAATVAAERSGAAEPGHAPDVRAAAWEEQARLAFRRGYGSAYGAGAGQPAPFLPASAERADALVALFETEKVFYELAYELQNRPGWVWIPLLGITQLLGR